MLDDFIDGPIAWQASDLDERVWRVALTDEALSELDAIARAFADYDGPFDALQPDAMDWPATTEVMIDVRTSLDQGIGFAIVDRMPVERWTEKGSRAVAWLLNNFLAPAIMQKWKGARVYDVRDTGAKLAYGIRRSVTNLEQEYHTDGSFLAKTPSLMGLACLRQAAEGGLSRIASLAAAHNVLRDSSPELLARLYRPFYWDRQAEHAAGEVPSSAHPVFWYDGVRLGGRYYDDYIRNGYKLMHQPIDDLGMAALAAMRQIVEAPGSGFEFRLKPGEVFFLNNHLVAHGRSAFRDAQQGDVAGGGRLLLRFWLRRGGGITLEASEPVPA
ncbi:MAG: TauD/TfdA family dioxygenase [Rhodospirillales bacterium]